MQIDLSEFYKPEGKQLLVHASEARIRVMKWGRGAGKSRCAFWEMFRLFLVLKDEERPITMVPKVHMWVVVPAYSQARQTWMELREFIPAAIIERASEADYTVALIGGGFLEIKSADNPQSLQTVGLDVVWFQEAARIPDEAFYTTLPGLSRGGRAGYILAESRPLRKHCWFETLFAKGQDPDDTVVESWHWAAPESPFVNKQQMEEDKGWMPESVWKQEYLAETQADEGAAFQNVRGCIKGDIEEPIANHTYVLGLDVGRVHDLTVFLPMDTGRRRVTDSLVQRKRDFTLQTEAAVQLSKKWNNASIIMDASPIGLGLYDMLRAAGLHVKGVPFSAKDKQRMYSRLMAALEQETISYPNIPELINQLEACQRTEGRYNDKIEAPPGYHDDFVASLALALEGCLPAAGVGGGKVITTTWGGSGGKHGGLQEHLRALKA